MTAGQHQHINIYIYLNILGHIYNKVTNYVPILHNYV